MILACDHLDKYYGDRAILRDASFHVQEKQKYALVGVNGVGKTTLLRILMDEERYDSGNITRSKDATIGYLPQQLGYHSDKSIFEELYQVRSDIIEQEKELNSLAEAIANKNDDSLLEKYHRLQTDFELKDGYAYKSRVLGVINGLGFGDSMDQVINTLSGGQKTRVALGKLLLTKPDLLILDEPTNHLDISSVQWLETYLASYPGAVLIVSHDRYFLDRFTENVWELDNGILRSFKGNYTDYMSQKELLKTSLMHAYEKQQAEIRHQEAVIEKLKQFNREKSIRRAESREKMLDKIDRIEKPVEYEQAMNLTLEPALISGEDVLFLEDLKKSFDDNTLFSDTTIEIKRGEKVAIIGDNGTGKTTLLKMINGDESITSGTITLGTNVELGYYDQEHGILHEDKTIFEEIQDAYPDLNNTVIRNTLAAFLFRGDDVFKLISSLSGGEKGRVSLAKLMLSKANLLLLDEPTNHLDMISREILENALKSYTGTVICVSHDRYFIDRVATRILDLSDGVFYDYKGNYSYYLEKKNTVMSINNNKTYNDTSVQTKDPSLDIPSDINSKTTSSGSSKADWLADKEIQAKRRRLERSLSEVEETIEKLEADISSIDEMLSDPSIGTNLPRLQELTKEREAADERLSEAMSKWEQLSEELEQV